jgi:4-diphosphocytidyl-2-C-methyl-D-erythritol kinase
MTLEKKSGCKINLLLNILGRRSDGFHELETVMQPVAIHDTLTFSRAAGGIQLTCSDTTLPVDSGNLVHRAATAFFQVAKIRDGVAVHLEKTIPVAAGLGGGSGNAAATLVGLNELFAFPLEHDALVALAATLGSDIPFFLQYKPALALGRGERVESLEPFPALSGKCLFLFHPGFGIATPWAYKALSRHPQALNGIPGRAARLIEKLRSESLTEAGGEFYNSLEAPALAKFPILALYQEFLRNEGAIAALMSGSGSTTFAVFPGRSLAEAVAEKFRARFGTAGWLSLVSLS